MNKKKLSVSLFTFSLLFICLNANAFGWGASIVIDSTNSLSEYPQSYIETTPFGRNLHTVWTDGNNSPYEVKYKKIINP